MTIQLGILLALVCAVVSNLGFFFKHRGACEAPKVDIRRPLRTAKNLYSSKWFAIGMGIATGAWLFHVAALAIAPISVVQAVLAGGVVMIARDGRAPVRRRGRRPAVVGPGADRLGLVLLVVTFPAQHDGAHSSLLLAGMIAFEAGLLGDRRAC